MRGGRRACALGLLAATLLAAVPDGQEPVIFTFRAGFWLHLHHFLYVLGRAEGGMRDSARRAVAGAPADQAAGLADATPEEQAAWGQAVTAYATGLSRRDVVFDRELSDLTAALAPLDEDDDVPAGMRADVRETLRLAAPAYRRLWWPGHGRRSRTYIDELQTWLRLEGPVIQSIVTRAFGQAWPVDGYRVNVAAYANWAGAYSTGDRLLVVASRDPGLAGTMGLEMIFHEASHQWDAAIEAKLQAAAQHRGVARIPGGLAHALVFYTAGEAVRRVIPPHRPYAEARGMWVSGPIARFKPTLDAHWAPYLRRGTGLGAALEALVAASP